MILKDQFLRKKKRATYHLIKELLLSNRISCRSVLKEVNDVKNESETLLRQFKLK